MTLAPAAGWRTWPMPLQIVVLSLAICHAGPVRAAGTVTVCTEASLRTALTGGGTVKFACDGTITLTSPIVMSLDTVLDATGHSIVLSGHQTVRVLLVNTGVKAVLNHLTVANGFVETVTPDFDTPEVKGGAGLHNSGDVTLNNCVFADNTAGGRIGDPSYMGNPGTPGGTGTGGAVYNDGGHVLAIRTSFNNNLAVGGAQGGMVGPGPDIGQDGLNAFGGGLYNANGSVDLRSCTFRQNDAHGTDGGSSEGSFDGGGAGRAGGGALYSAGGTVTVSGCAFSESAALGGSGGWGGDGSAFGQGDGGSGASGGDGLGGAVSVDGAGAAMTLTNCTLFSNKAQGGSGGFGGAADAASGGTQSGSGGSGGNGLGGSLFDGNGSLTVINCTVASGSATAGQPGAGGAGDSVNHIATGPSGRVGVGRGGGVAVQTGRATLRNTIVAYNDEGGNGFGTLVDGGHNISSDSTCHFGTNSLNNTDPLLGPFANNGGPSFTMGLYPGSRALNAADAAASPPTDQRGVARPQGPGFDIGAFEGVLANDTVNPAVTIILPVQGAAVHALAAMQGKASDNMTVRRVMLIFKRNSDNRYWNGSAWVAQVTVLATHLDNLGNAAGNLVLWRRDNSMGQPSGSNLVEGAYTVQAIAYDGAGNRSAAGSSFSVDKTAPVEATITTPANGTTVANLNFISGQAVDNLNGSGIAHVDLIIQRLSDNQYWTGKQWSLNSTVLPTTLSGSLWSRSSANPAGSSLSNGRYLLVARAYDRAGNVTRAVSVVTVTNTATRDNEPAPAARSSATCSMGTVRAAGATVQLSFTGDLDGASAADPDHYAVLVSGNLVAAESALYNASTHTVLLSLPDGCLQSGAGVVVQWSGLLDVAGRSFAGRIGPLPVH